MLRRAYPPERCGFYIRRMEGAPFYSLWVREDSSCHRVLDGEFFSECMGIGQGARPPSVNYRADLKYWVMAAIKGCASVGAGTVPLKILSVVSVWPL